MTGQFEFHHLDCYNALYNPNGSVFLSKNTPLINTHDARFDYILAGSLFSHLGISDASNYFSSLLQYSTNNTKFVFSLFLDVNVVDVHDADSVSHMRILYNPRTAESLLRDAGWEIERAYLQDWKMRAYVPEWNAVPLNSIAGIPSERQSFLLARRSLLRA